MRQVDFKYLNDAAALLRKMRRLHEKSRVFKKKAVEAEAHILLVEKSLKENDQYLCEHCGTWGGSAQMAKLSSPLIGNKCRKCSDDYYFEVLAKSTICSSGISLYNVPNDLIQIEKIRAKTRFTIKNLQKIKITQQ